MSLPAQQRTRKARRRKAWVGRRLMVQSHPPSLQLHVPSSAARMPVPTPWPECPADKYSAQHVRKPRRPHGSPRRPKLIRFLRRARAGKLGSWLAALPRLNWDRSHSFPPPPNSSRPSCKPENNSRTICYRHGDVTGQHFLVRYQGFVRR